MPLGEPYPLSSAAQKDLFSVKYNRHPDRVTTAMCNGLDFWSGSGISVGEHLAELFYFELYQASVFDPETVFGVTDPSRAVLRVARIPPRQLLTRRVPWTESPSR